MNPFHYTDTRNPMGRSPRRVGIVARSAIVLFAVAGSALAQGKPTTGVALISANQMARVVPKVRAIHAEPGTITMRVGETVGLDKIAVTVLDSLGNVRGRLAGFDFSIPPGQAASVMPFKITGVKAGKTELLIHFPRRDWAPRTDPRPEAKVTIIVKP